MKNLNFGEVKFFRGTRRVMGWDQIKKKASYRTVVSISARLYKVFKYRGNKFDFWGVQGHLRKDGFQKF